LPKTVSARLPNADARTTPVPWAIACHNPRWWSLLPTKLPISSTSAASTRRTSTVIASGHQPSPTLVLTTERPDAFFELREYRVRTDVPTPGAIPYPPPLERPLAQLPLHRGQPPRICIGLQERPPTALTLLPAQPPLPITGLARLSHGLSLTMRTPHACFRPRLPSSLMPS